MTTSDDRHRADIVAAVFDLADFARRDGAARRRAARSNAAPPCRIARCSGVLPSLFETFGSAPAFGMSVVKIFEPLDRDTP